MIGKTLILDKTPTTIIVVMPPEFNFFDDERCPWAGEDHGGLLGSLDCGFNNAAAMEEPFVPTAAFTEAQFDPWRSI